MSTRWRKVAVAVGFLGLLAWTFRALLGGRVLGAGDVSRMAIPDATFLLECLKAREWPTWTPYAHLGQPFAAALHTQAYYLPRVFFAWVFGPVWGITLEQLFHCALASVGTYGACRALGRSRGAAFVAGAAFAASPLAASLFFVPNIAAAAAWSGVLLWTGRRFIQHPSAQRACAVSLAAAGSFAAGSPETWIWQAALVVWVLARARRPLPSAAIGAALLLAFGLAGMLTLPGIELARETVRTSGAVWTGQDFWSADLLSVLRLGWLPTDLALGQRGPALFPSMFQGTWLALLALGAGSQRGTPRRLLIAALVFAVLALGQQFAPSAWLLSLPPLSWFRYPIKYLVGTAFSLCIAAAFGVDRVRAWARTRSWRGARPLGVGVVCLVLAELWLTTALQGTWGWALPATLEQASPLKTMLPEPHEGRVSIRFEDDALRSRWPRAQERIAQSRPWLVPMRNVEEGVAIVEGYGPPELRRFVAAMQASPKGLFDLAGVTHYLRLGPAPYPDLEREHVPMDGFDVYRSSSAFPRAYLTQTVRSVSDDEALQVLTQNPSELRHEALLARDDGALSGVPSSVPCASTPPAWRMATPSRLELEVDACGPSQLVVTDSFFPGWRASVDGVEVPIRRAQFLVRAVFIPPGRHRLTMEYHPKSATWGWAVACAAWGALAVAWMTGRSQRGFGR